ncbi:MAG: DUF3244 domain-containing protein [Bacteroidaceae bacterium]|nr:DUF3244 domain-containing protein [Bacteroidaceae bacterium]
MKKLFIYALLFLTLGTGASAKATVKEGGIDIPIKREQVNNYSDVPKMPERIPISCEYLSGVLYFDFYHDLGAVSVIVTNLTTGEQWQVLLPTTDIATMNVSEESGNYRIEITTINNKVYYGEYDIL